MQIHIREIQKEAQRAKILLSNELNVDRDGSSSSGQLTFDTGATQVAPQGPGAPRASTPSDANFMITKSVMTVDMQNYVLAEYLMDFGNVIKGVQITKTFKVSNVGYAQLSFEFSKSAKSSITNAGFIVEPDRVNRLPGAPDFESVDFTVIFNSSRPSVKLGPLELLIPLQIKTGPQV